MRRTATFPAGDTGILKKKLVSWAGNFFCSVFIDHNGYRQFNPAIDCLAAAGAVSSLQPDPEGIFPAIKSFYDQQPDWLFGYLTYDLKNEVEPKVFNKNNSHVDGVKFPIAHFFRPKHIVQLKADQLIIESTEDPEKIFEAILFTAIDEIVPVSKASPEHRMTKDEYLQAVEHLKNHILNGDVYEVNFCQEFFVENFHFKPCTLFNRLNEINPAPFACFLKHDDHYLLCASPERFLKKEGNKITSQPMKGTLARNDSEEVSLLMENLRNDPKERAENVMIVDLVRNDLARSSVPGSVKVDELFGIYSFPNVYQMVSTVSSTLRPDTHFTDAIKNAFPMGSMTGAPKIKAMQLIDQYEKTKRGLFSGAVGFITPEGDFDFYVVIRSFLYNATTPYLSFQTGSAITFDSNPEKEYEESLLKAKALIAALQ